MLGGRDRARCLAVGAEPGAPGLQDLVAGGIDIVTCSVPEAQALLEAGRVKSLAVMSAERNPAFPDVPTLKEATGLDWQVAAWRGIAGPKGMPQEVSDKLVPLLKQIWDSQEFRDFMAQRGFSVVWQDPQGFRAVDGRERREPRQRDEGGRSRQLADPAAGRRRRVPCV